MNENPKSQATFFKEEIEASINRYGSMSVYETIGALEVVKQNLLERLGRMYDGDPGVHDTDSETSGLG
jgi:hypothetical protein